MLSTSVNRPARPQRLLLVITDLDVGGAEKCCAQLALGLDRRRWQPAVCSLSPPGAVADRLRCGGVPVYSLDARAIWSAPAAVLRLVRLVRRFRPVLVHTFLFHANVIGRIASRLAGVPRVVSSIRVAERRYRSHLVFENLTCRLSNRVICVSRGVAAFTRRCSQVPASRIAVIPNGVEPNEAASATRLAIPGVDPNAVIAGYVGRLDAQKGVDVLLRAFARARESLPQLALVLVGAGPDRAALESLARQLDLADRVHFLGWRADVPALLRSLDLFVLPSRWEGMPNVVLEAMAAGLPVVATRTEGTTELVRHGETGLLVDVDAAAELADALVATAGDSGRRAAWGSRGRELVEREFSLARMIARFEQLYSSVLAGTVLG